MQAHDVSSFRRAVILVADGVGCGAAPDAAAYGDAGADTLGNIARAIGRLSLPNLGALGLGHLTTIAGTPPDAAPRGAWGALQEASAGKDTITGHWEMAGLVTDRALPTFPHGFPPEITRPLSIGAGRGLLGNKPASGTAIIEELGPEHIRTGDLILYTSADSVLQIAAHEEVVPLHELHRICEVARAIADHHQIGRVIARPFVGIPGEFHRTYNRRDYALVPPAPTLLDDLRGAGMDVVGIGKISDIFAGQYMDSSSPTESNAQGIARTKQLLRTLPEASLVFTNLVETDMVWGHRNDPEGFADCLREFDEGLPGLMTALRHGDLLVLTSDHGCDPTTPSTDHSREHAMLLAHLVGAPMAGRRHDGDTFADVGATVQRHLTGRHDGDLPGTPVL